MRQFILSLFITLLSVSVSAWDFTENVQKYKTTIYTTDLSPATLVNQYPTPYHLTAKMLYEPGSGFRVENGLNAVMSLPSGIFVGQTKNSSNQISNYNAFIMMGSNECRPFSKVTMTYYLINSDNGFKSANNGYSVSDNAISIAGGYQYRKAEFTYKVPSEVLTIKYSDSGSWDTSSAFAKNVGNGMRGIVITKLEIEYVTSYEVYDIMGNYLQTTQQELKSTKAELATTKSQLSTAQSKLASTTSELAKAQNEEAKYKITNTIDNNERIAYNLRYTAAANGDVNSDGLVNAGDVVSIYNNISGDIPTDNVYNGHRYIDLALPSGILWAESNIGATVPEGMGDYFSWADKGGSLISGKMPFDADHYQSDLADAFYAQEGNSMGIYLPPVASTLYKNSWNGWNVPSVKNCKELIDNCTAELKLVNGVLGTLFTSKHNHRTIFFPHGGYINGTQLKDTYVVGAYWTGTPLSAGKASILSINSFSTTTEEVARHTGCPIRCILPKSALK